jgi:adenylate cyclase
MAIFRLDCEAALACRQALHAAGRMAASLRASTNQCRTISTLLSASASALMLAQRSWARWVSTTFHLTAIGDTVNNASCLETLTKEFAVELVMSEELLERVGLSLASHPCHDT